MLKRNHLILLLGLILHPNLAANSAEVTNHDYMEWHGIPIKLFAGKLSAFKSACFMPEKVFNTYNDCGGGCETIILNSDGTVVGALGCDVTFDGTWQYSKGIIAGRYRGGASCNHFIPGEIMNNPVKVEEFCNTFHAKHSWTGTFTLKNIRQGMIEVVLKDRHQNTRTGYLYYPISP